MTSTALRNRTRDRTRKHGWPPADAPVRTIFGAPVRGLTEREIVEFQSGIFDPRPRGKLTLTGKRYEPK